MLEVQISYRRLDTCEITLTMTATAEAYDQRDGVHNRLGLRRVNSKHSAQFQIFIEENWNKIKLMLPDIIGVSSYKNISSISYLLTQTYSMTALNDIDVELDS